MSEIAVFLDRDGTVARDVSYCSRVEDLQILSTVPEAIKILNEKGLKVIIVTNQSGITRGYFNEETLAEIHAKLEDELARHGAHIDAIYYCPHHPDEGCDCRKPGTALFQRAAIELAIEFGNSYMVGDMQTDIDAGRALGCRTVLVTTGPKKGKDIVEPADYIASDLMKAVQWIISMLNEADPNHEPEA